MTDAETEDHQYWEARKQDARTELTLLADTLIHDLTSGIGRDMLALDLQELGGLDWDLYDLEIPQSLVSIMGSHKTDIIRSLLEEIQQSRDPREYLYAVEFLRRCGFAWPELDVIEKSLRAGETSIKESRNDPSSSRDLLRYLQQDLKNGRYDDIWETVTELAWKEDFKDAKSMGPLLDQHKAGVMRSLLEFIAHNHVDDSQYLMSQVDTVMRRLGVSWPELDIIERSLDAERERRQDLDLDEASSEHDKDEAERTARRVSAQLHDLSRLDPQDSRYNGRSRDVAWAIAGMPRGHVEMLAPILDHHKQMIMTDLLRSLRDDPGDQRWGATHMLDALDHARVMWPELTVIKRSMHSDRLRRMQPVDENTQLAKPLPHGMQAPDTEQGWIDLIAQHPWIFSYIKKPSDALKKAVITAVPSNISRMKDPSAELQRHALSIAGPGGLNWIRRVDPTIWADPAFKAQTMRYILGYIGSDDADAKRQITNWKNSGCPWPELDTVLRSITKSLDDSFFAKRYGQASLDDDKQKTRIIRDMLRQMKKGKLADAKRVLKILRGRGADWSELDVIEHSLRAIGKLDEAIRGQHRWIQRVADQLEQDLQRGDWVSANYTVQRLNQTDPKEVQEIFQPLAPLLVNMVKAGPLDTLTYMERIMSHVASTYPEVIAAYDAHKTEIMRKILQLIARDQDGMGYYHADGLIRQLRNIGVDWPEFRIIGQSISEDSNDDAHERELHRQGADIAMDLLRRDLRGHRGIYYMLYHMHEYGMNLDMLPDAEALINDHKQELIRGMLESFHDLHGLGSIQQVLERLRYVGIAWPELDTIERSLRAEQARKGYSVQESKDPTPEEINADIRMAEQLFKKHKTREAVYATARLPTLYSHSTQAHRVAGMLEDHKDQILGWIVHEQSPSMLGLVENILISNGLDWRDQIHDTYEAIKHGVVRDMLQRLRTTLPGNMSTVKHEISVLRSKGIDWPEFDAMLRSINAHTQS